MINSWTPLGIEGSSFAILYGCLFWANHHRDKRWQLEQQQQRNEERKAREQEWKQEAAAWECKLEEARNAWKIAEDVAAPWRVYDPAQPDTHPAQQHTVMLFLADGRKVPATYLPTEATWRRLDNTTPGEVLCWRPVRSVS